MRTIQKALGRAAVGRGLDTANILVVDDDPNTRELYNSLLTPFGHQVVEAADGRDGLNAAQRTKPDLILSDILMPTMNGYEFVSSLRKLPGLQDTAVIFQSASFLDHQTRALGAQCGVLNFISKPSEPEKILETVNRVLGLPTYPTSPSPSLVQKKDTLSLLVDAFYSKGQQLDALSVRLSALVEFGFQIAQKTQPECLLETALHAARKVIGANYAGAGLVRENSFDLQYHQVAGMEPATAAQISHQDWASIVQQVVAEGKILRVMSKADMVPAFGLPSLHPPVRHFLGMPIQNLARTYGFIYIADTPGGTELTTEDELLLGTIASRLAVGFESILRELTLQQQMVRLEREIEQRKQAEERFRLLIETAPTGILICDRMGRITDGNAQLQRMFGYTREELIGQPIETLVPEQHRGNHVKQRTSYTDAPQARHMGLGRELHARKKDGTTFPVEISLGPLATDEGMLISSTIVDITERKKLERQVQVSQRLESVGQLAAGIAHDFNNILTAISGNTRLALTDMSPDDPVRLYLAEIEKGSSRATMLVRQILTFSRQEEPKRQVIKLAPVVDEALGLLRAGLRAGIEIRTHFDGGLPDVSADSTQIHQIIMNLGSNAADAMKERGGALEVGLEAVSVDADLAQTSPDLHPGLYTRLSIRDTGRGMDKALIERIFEPFYTTKAQGEGTGLGLSVVHGIMKTHRGAITVHSQPGTGTLFHLYFPAAQEAAKEASPRPSGGEVLGHGERVLYVDDEEPLVLLMTRMLGRLGYNVTGCTDPKKAIAMFRSRPDEFDVVVTDLSMPGMTGTHLARELLQLRSGLPILIASGYIRPADNAEVRRLGLPDLILKPDTVEQLGEILHRLFEKLEAPRGTDSLQETEPELHRQAASSKA